MRYLILGLGFVGTHLAEYLSNYGEVIITYRTLNPVKELYVRLLKEKNVNVIRLDPLNERERLNEEISRADAVINLIGEIQGSYKTLEVPNVLVPKLIAELAGQNKKMLVHFSGLLGVTGTNVKPEEPHLAGIKPQTDFEKTKFEGEKEVYEAHKKYGIPVAILRPTLIYGRYSAHMQFVTMYKLAKIGIVPNLSFNFNTINAYSIAKMVKALIDSRETTYFYATECEPVKVSRFFELMAEALGKRKIKIPVPESLAKVVLPKYIRELLKYTRSTFDCSKSRELVEDLYFNEKEIFENAKFLSELERNGILIPT